MSQPQLSVQEGAEMKKLKRVASRARSAAEAEILDFLRKGGVAELLRSKKFPDRINKLLLAHVLARSLYEAIADTADSIGPLEFMESQEEIALLRRQITRHIDPALIEELAC